jgi:hypothetical protein
VREFAGFVGLVFQLAGLGLKEMVALLQCSHPRSRNLALAGHPYSTNYRVDLWEGKWHVRTRYSGYSGDDCFWS